MVSMLLNAGAQVDAKGWVGDTPLHYAARYGLVDVIPILLKAGAQVDAKNKFGQTALHEAARSGSAEVVLFLLVAGAQLDAKDKAGGTPMDLAMRPPSGSRGAGHVAVEKILKNWGSQAGQAVNDQAKGGVDRLGYEYYAKALYRVLSKCDPPLCVGLYGRWGSGKSFLVQLLKWEFDPDLEEDLHSKELTQRFERSDQEGATQSAPLEWDALAVLDLLLVLWMVPGGCLGGTTLRFYSPLLATVCSVVVIWRTTAVLYDTVASLVRPPILVGYATASVLVFFELLRYSSDSTVFTHYKDAASEGGWVRAFVDGRFMHLWVSSFMRVWGMIFPIFIGLYITLAWTRASLRTIIAEWSFAALKSVQFSVALEDIVYLWSLLFLPMVIHLSSGAAIINGYNSEIGLAVPFWVLCVSCLFLHLVGPVVASAMRSMKETHWWLLTLLLYFLLIPLESSIGVFLTAEFASVLRWGLLIMGSWSLAKSSDGVRASFKWTACMEFSTLSLFILFMMDSLPKYTLAYGEAFMVTRFCIGCLLPVCPYALVRVLFNVRTVQSTYDCDKATWVSNIATLVLVGDAVVLHGLMTSGDQRDSKDFEMGLGCIMVGMVIALTLFHFVGSVLQNIVIMYWNLLKAALALVATYPLETHLRILWGTILSSPWPVFEPPRPPTRSEKVEYVFVDFNAWEFSGSDELWSGLIRGMYDKVEQRLEFEARRRGGAGTDFKREWRIQKAIQLLEEQYGGKVYLQAAVVLSTIVISLLAVLAVNFLDKVVLPSDFWELEAYVPEVLDKLVKKESENVLVSAILSAVSFFWSKSIFQSAGKDRGRAIYEKVKAVKDDTGIMAMVKGELSELFAFINKDFKKATGIQLRLVLFVDDLDRCLGGRNVKMLESIYLLLSFAGAPVLTFLMIDSRVVVASIEKSLNASVSLADSLHLAWEYLEKIVQIGICLPDSSEERTRRYVQYVVKKNLTLNSILDMILQLQMHRDKLLRRIKFMQAFNFKLWCHFPVTVVEGQEIGGYCMAADKFFEAIEKANLFRSLKELSGLLNFGRSRNRSVFEVYGEKEGLEVLLQQAEQLLKGAQFFFANATENNTSTDRSEPSVFQPIDPDGKGNSFRINWSDIKADGGRYKYVNADGNQIIDLPEEFQSASFAGGNDSLPDEMSAELASLVGLVECNPRGMKRIVNLLQIIFVLGTVRPYDDQLSTVPIAFSKEKDKWERFLKKTVLWIVLCQSFPYRMSLLVQLLMDFDQKQNFNANATKMTDRRGFEYRNASGHGPKLVEEMSIFRFYMLYVDKYVKAFDKADRFCRMDKDPEEFAALLQRTVSDSNKEETITCDDVLGPKHASEHHTTDKRPSPTSESPSDGPTSSPTDDAQQGPSTSESSPTPANESASAPAASEGGKAAAAASTTDDAPLKSSTSESSPTPADDSASAPPASEGGKDGGQRDKTYSLLSYSFNLDPALRNEIGEEIASVVTDFELYVRMDCEPNPNPNPVSAWKPLSLQRGGVPRKQSIVTAISRDEKTFDYNAPLHGTPAAVQGLDIEEEGAPQTVRFTVFS
eukprot:gene25794-34378_t